MGNSKRSRTRDHYEMVNLKRSRTRTRDRLSELPDSLIFDIFSYLPIIEVVRTTILSKRWRDLWKTVPFLNLDYYSAFIYSMDRTRAWDFFNRALMLWSGAKILKFKIDFECLSPPIEPFEEIIDVSLRLAKEKSAAELEVHLHEINSTGLYQFFDDYYLVPQYLYSCSSLEVLSITGCNLQIHENNTVKWDRLKSLTINVDLGRIKEDVISQILLGSPKLEVFVLSVIDDYESFPPHFWIESTSLKKLSIVKLMGLGPLRIFELAIRTPNLETLEILGFTCDEFPVNASSLTDVTLGFRPLYNEKFEKMNEELDKMIKETLKQILPTTGYVESVTLSTDDWCDEELGFLKKICSKFLEKDVVDLICSHVDADHDEDIETRYKFLKIRINSRSS